MTQEIFTAMSCRNVGVTFEFFEDENLAETTRKFILLAIICAMIF